MADEIVVVPYDETWRDDFTVERELLQQVLEPWLLCDIEHVGSTAVPGMTAKPVIDMIAGIADLDAARAAVGPLRQIDYQYRPHRPEALLFDKPGGDWRTHTHHLHLTVPGSDLWVERLAFRDALRGNPALVAEYTAWKQAHVLGTEDGPYDASKTPFVSAVLVAAGIALKPDEQRLAPSALVERRDLTAAEVAVAAHQQATLGEVVDDRDR